MVPKPDFLYGWVPGGLPYNGMAFLNSPVAMGNTQSWKYQRTYAHEVGHNIGRQHVSNQIVWPGIDVEHHLSLPASNNLGQLKPLSLFDIMVAGLNTNQAWVRANMYNYIFNHPNQPLSPRQSSFCAPLHQKMMGKNKQKLLLKIISPNSNHSRLSLISPMPVCVLWCEHPYTSMATW